MKQILKIVSIIFLICFSFFYTNQAIKWSRLGDPIMKQVMEEGLHNFINPISIGKISATEVRVGSVGYKIDINKSYEAMKQVGTYQDNLLVYKEVKPANSINDNLNKYVVLGNSRKQGVTLVFRSDNIADLKVINGIIKEKGIMVTFINRNDLFFSNAEVYKLYNPDFCYTIRTNRSLLNDCAKNNKITVKPIQIRNSLYKNIKNKVVVGSIFEIEVNQNNVNELPLVINYLKNKGYKLLPLSEHIRED